MEVEPSRSSPTGMQFQKRDGQILLAIYNRDGVLSRRQLKAMFWPGKSWRAMEKRLGKLHQQQYLKWPSAEQRRSRPIPEPIVWLDWKGISWIAGQSGIQPHRPAVWNENQLRKLERQLRGRGIHWLREPRWAQLEHDLAVGDFRLSVEQAVEQYPAIRLETWVPETVFHANPDIVEYQSKGRGGILKRNTRRVCPDGYFTLIDGQRPASGQTARSRFLLEMDMATHDNPSFGQEKVLPGLAYLRSPAYRQHFGDNSGRWLVVTTGERRMQNLKRQAEAQAGRGAGAFYFTTLNRVRAETVLTQPIWWPAGADRPVPLFARSIEAAF